MIFSLATIIHSIHRNSISKGQICQIKNSTEQILRIHYIWQRFPQYTHLQLVDIGKQSSYKIIFVQIQKE